MQREYATVGGWPDLFRETRRIQDEMNRFFGGLRSVSGLEQPAVNVWAGVNGAMITAEVPGVVPDQLDVSVHQDTVTLRGKREREDLGAEVVAHREERPHGAFARTIVLPFRVDADNVAARFERGILVLELPRPTADKPRQVKIARA